MARTDDPFEPATDKFLFRGPKLCTAKSSLIVGLLLGLAITVAAIAMSWK